jgi:hypothetical protein
MSRMAEVWQVQSCTTLTVCGTHSSCTGMIAGLRLNSRAANISVVIRNCVVMDTLLPAVARCFTVSPFLHSIKLLSPYLLVQAEDDVL